MTERPSDEAVERMVALVSKMAERHTSDWKPYNIVDYQLAYEITAMLPKPVDPALRIVRVIVAEALDAVYERRMANLVESGQADNQPVMVRALSAYHAGQASRSE